MSAIVGRSGTQWNAKATIDHDNHEQCKIIARVLLDQRNKMYDELVTLRQVLFEVGNGESSDTARIDDLLKKSRGE